MLTPISQSTYTDYRIACGQIKLVEQFQRKHNFDLIFSNAHFTRNKQPLNIEGCVRKLSKEESQEIENKINFINRIHHFLKEGFEGRALDDCALLSMSCYKQHLETINNWNAQFPSKIELLHEELISTSDNFSIPDKTERERKDKEALDNYFKLLEENPD